jgi:hypothetical protein
MYPRSMHKRGEWEEVQRGTDNGEEGDEDGANATETFGVISSA